MKVNWSQTYAELAPWLVKNDLTALQIVKSSCWTSSQIISFGEFSRPAKIQCDGNDTNLGWNEGNSHWENNLRQWTYRLLSTPSFVRKLEWTLAKWNNLQKIDPKIPLTGQCDEPVTNPVIWKGNTKSAKMKSDGHVQDEIVSCLA